MDGPKFDGDKAVMKKDPHKHNYASKMVAPEIVPVSAHAHS